MKLLRHSLHRATLPVAIAVILSGCAQFNSKTLSPAAGSATNVEARTLADPGLKRFVEANLKGRLEPLPLESWDLPKLALAASYFRSYLENAAVWQARANVRRTYFTTWRRNVASKC